LHEMVKKPADSASNFLNSPNAIGESITPNFIPARDRANSAFKNFKKYEVKEE